MKPSLLLSIPILIATALLLPPPALAQTPNPAALATGKPVSKPTPPPNMPAVPKGVTFHEDIEFAQTPQGPLSLLLAIPETDKAKPLPLIVIIHGGGWQEGTRYSGIHGVFFYARNGFACASIDYRLSQNAPWPAQIQDCKAAIRFLRANAAKYGIDPDHIGVQGDSAGGHLVAMLGLTADKSEFEGDGGNPGVSSSVQAVTDFFGPSDLTAWVNDPDPERKKKLISSPGVTRFLGAPISEVPDRAANASPLTYVKDCKNPAPFLILHGTKDPAVPISQSFILADALEERKADVTFRVALNQGHGGGGFALKVNADCIAFFNRTLKGEKPKP